MKSFPSSWGQIHVKWNHTPGWRPEEKVKTELDTSYDELRSCVMISREVASSAVYDGQLLLLADHGGHVLHGAERSRPCPCGPLGAFVSWHAKGSLPAKLRRRRDEAR